MNSQQGGPLHFLADIITNSASNDGIENSGGVILTQPPEEVIAKEDTPAATTARGTARTMNRDMNEGGGADPPSSSAPKQQQQQQQQQQQPARRKSKLKKANRQSSKSVLETMSSETSAAMTTTKASAAAAGAGGTKQASCNDSSNSNAANSQQQQPATAAVHKKCPNTSSTKMQLLSQITIGAKVEVYWGGDDTYYPGTVISHVVLKGGTRGHDGKDKREGHVYSIHYDDGEVENVDLATERFRVVGYDATATTTSKKTSSLPSLATTSNNVATTSPEAAAAVEAVGKLRITLDELRKKRNSTKKILAILNDLDARNDIDFHTLFHTGIGKAVNKLVKHQQQQQRGGNSKITEAATPLLQKWRMIDESTPGEVKIAVKEAANGTTVRNGGGDSGNSASLKTPMTADNDDAAVVVAVPPVTPASAGKCKAIDLTASSPSKVQRRGAQSKAQEKQQQTQATATNSAAAAAAAAAKITPASIRNTTIVDHDGSVEVVGGGAKKKRKKPMPPSPPELESSSSYKENDVVVVAVQQQQSSKKKKVKGNDATTSSACAPAVKRQQQQPASINKQTECSATKQPAASSAVSNTQNASKKQPASTNPNNATQPPTATKSNSNATKQPSQPSSSSTTNKPKPSATATAAKEPPTKKKNKKRTFGDQILYTMLTTCKPYTLKSLAKETNTTVEGLRHAMLSFLDKQIVICKEFPSKNSTREPKKLYWANPLSLSEIENGKNVASGGGGKGKKGGGGKGAIVKELCKLLSTTQEIEEARKSHGQLEQQHRSILAELNPLLAIPTMQELDDQLSAEEHKLQQVQKEIQAVKDRMANTAAKASPAPRMSSGGGRFYKPPPTKPQSPTTLKRKINHMLGEYKTRKRKCMDFVEELSDAMEKKVKDVVGDKVLMLDTDELEWGCYEDEATGKVYGTMPKQAGGGRRNAGLLLGRGKDDGLAMKIVKIPAKYKDV
ncbi:hypothetical protein ACHAXR_011038 [Thalassiosira sp. AJA248-18]